MPLQEQQIWTRLVPRRDKKHLKLSATKSTVLLGVSAILPLESPCYAHKTNIVEWYMLVKNLGYPPTSIPTAVV